MDRREMLNESLQSLAKTLPSILAAVGGLGGFLKLRSAESAASDRPASFPLQRPEDKPDGTGESKE